MTSLSLSIAPPALVRLHDALLCLSKFSETVAIEAEPDLLRLSVLNSTKTAYVAFAFQKEQFFEAFSFSVRWNPHEKAAAGSGHSDRFCCQIYNKALLSVFRGRIDRNKDTAVERCDMQLHEDSHQTECRLIVKMMCGLGVIKSYKLIYEPATIQHAVFDRSKSTSQWTADARFLRQTVEHFSASAELLDLYSDSGKAVFTSFTTKVTEGKEILKQPVHTSVAIDKRDFADFIVEDNMHIAINLKDFKAVVAHAETANAIVTARYTRPCKPLQLTYDFEGVDAQFTIMTRGETDGEDVPASSRTSMAQLSARQTPAPVPIRANQTTNGNDASRPETQMRPPLARPRSIRPLVGSSTQEHLAPRSSAERLPASGSASIEFDSLFVPGDDDRQWDEVNEEEEPQDILGWDATGETTFDGTLRDAEPAFPRLGSKRTEREKDDVGIPPTQRMSQVRGLGLFD